MPLSCKSRFLECIPESQILVSIASTVHVPPVVNTIAQIPTYLGPFNINIVTSYTSEFIMFFSVCYPMFTWNTLLLIGCLIYICSLSDAVRVTWLWTKAIPKPKSFRVLFVWTFYDKNCLRYNLLKNEIIIQITKQKPLTKRPKNNNNVQYNSDWLNADLKLGALIGYQNTLHYS